MPATSPQTRYADESFELLRNQYPFPAVGSPAAGPQPPTSEVQLLKLHIAHHLRHRLALHQPVATSRHYYLALVYTLRECLTEWWVQTQKRYYDSDVKRVYYLSSEFLPGRLLDQALVNLRLEGACRQALADFGERLDDLCELEEDFGLGAGGLGRLAACYLESMSTLGLPAYGYGIRYEYGAFYQAIDNGYQVERSDSWLRLGNPWEVERAERLYPVRFQGAVQNGVPGGWVGPDVVMAMAFDVPVPGYGNGVVNTLRLWSAKSSRELDLHYFNHGDYTRAVEEKNRSENISRILYPCDAVAAGRELRLRQEYFLVSASLQDILARYTRRHDSFDRFPDRVAIQLNDTHPALAVPELMRLLVDVEGLPWDRAWEMTTATVGFTNHTLMAEALEQWPVAMLGHLLPRHLQIIYEINHRFLGEVARRYPNDPDRLRRVSLVAEGAEKQVRMAHLAVVGSHAVNGVSQLHSQLLRDDLFPDFRDLFPGRFSNTTNGITPRLWLGKANPGLAALITRSIGDGWITDLGRLERLAPLADDAAFRAAWADVKRQNKQRLADLVSARQAVSLDPGALFDCQAKRIHEYKRQLLNVLHVVARHQRLRDGHAGVAPRAVLFAGKASPGYATAKCIVKLIHAVADVVNCDPVTADRLRVVFLPNYNVSLAVKIAAAADLSEQISTAGTEASGTGNMKMALNGALTIGTLDGANIEIRDAVGADNFFHFGLTADEVRVLRPGYRPADVYQADGELRRAVDLIRDGYFSPNQPDLFRPLIDGLLHSDPYFVLADFRPFVDCQDRVDALWRDPHAWTRTAILNVARMGFFSSDRAVREYARDAWGVDG